MTFAKTTRRLALLSAAFLAGLVACAAPEGEPVAAEAAALAGAPRALAVTRILLTNDDGIGAPGLQAIYTAVRAIPNTEVKVVAPALNQSGTGSGITSSGAMTLNQNAPLLNGVDTGVALGGKPADTVRFALQKVYPPGVKPDLIISGCNSGQNPGLTFGSGTVGAAQTGALSGVKSIACSLGTTFQPPAVFGSNLAEYADAAAAIRTIVEAIIAGGQSPDPGARQAALALQRSDMLNVNVPPRNVQGMRLTRPGAFDVAINYVTLPDGRISPQVDLTSLETFSPAALAQGLETDVGALAAGFVTVVPWRHADLSPLRFVDGASALSP
ncbi:MAG TPA: 5'/3'-nucleotidase SurE [Polyangiaceae bacterium]|nr:5'/3'-nucleotidase SurE [Polyangiaceae bacterium]